MSRACHSWPRKQGSAKGRAQHEGGSQLRLPLPVWGLALRLEDVLAWSPLPRDLSRVGPLTVLLWSTGMHASWPAQAVPGEQPADDGAVGSQGVHCEHHAGVSGGQATGQATGSRRLHAPCRSGRAEGQGIEKSLATVSLRCSDRRRHECAGSGHRAGEPAHTDFHSLPHHKPSPLPKPEHLSQSR